MVRTLLDAKASPNAKGTHGWQPLLTAAARSHPDVAAALIEAGADIDAKNEFGSTPLSLAAEKGDFRTVRSLLTARADPNRLGGGKTALVWAAARGAGLRERERVMGSTATPPPAAAAGSSTARMASPLFTMITVNTSRETLDKRHSECRQVVGPHMLYNAVIWARGGAGQCTE